MPVCAWPATVYYSGSFAGSNLLEAEAMGYVVSEQTETSH
jgi:hypothetical protein